MRGDFNDSDCEDPRDIACEDWVEWCDFIAPDVPVTDCTSVMVVGETSAPMQLQQDSWDASVSVADVGTVETAEGIPVAYGGDYDYSDYKVLRFETMDGMPVYYGGDLNDSDCEDPRDIAYEVWVDWRDFSNPDEDCGFFPDDGEAQLPVTDGASVMVVGETAAPIRLQQNSWDASVLVADIDPGPVIYYLRPPCCQGPMEREDYRKNYLQDSLWDSCGPPCDLGVTASIESDIWSQDTGGNIGSESASWHVMPSELYLSRELCMATLDGNGTFAGALWDPGGVGTSRLILCCDCVCLIEMFRNILPCSRGCPPWF